jgi:hypothetical protein
MSLSWPMSSVLVDDPGFSAAADGAGSWHAGPA